MSFLCLAMSRFLKEKQVVVIHLYWETGYLSENLYIFKINQIAKRGFVRAYIWYFLVPVK